MKIKLLIFTIFFGTQLIAMENDFKIAEKTSLNHLNNTLLDDTITFAIKNTTGIIVKMRGRFGPTKQNPVGYICDEDNPKAAQIFVLKNDQGIKFKIEKKFLPLRIRTWPFNYTPDDDMEGNIAVQSSSSNRLHTLKAAAIDNEEHDFNYSKNIIYLTWDSILEKYDFKVSKEDDDEGSYTTGYTNNYRN